MDFYRNLPIRFRLTISLFVLCSLCIALFVAGIVIYEWLTYQERVKSNLTSDAEMLVAGFGIGLELGDHERVGQVIGKLDAVSNIEAAFVIKADGTVFAEYVRKGVVDLSNLPNTDGFVVRERRIYLVRRIMAEGDFPLGRLVLVADTRDFQQRLMGYGVLLGIMAGVLLILAAIVSIVLQNSFASPLVALTGLAEKMSLDDRHAGRAPVRSNDEIGRLTVAFNRMLDVLQRREQALRTSEERYRLLVENSHELVSEITLDGRFIYVSPTFKAMLGYEANELIGTSLYDLVVGDDLVATQPLLARPLASVIHRFYHEDGGERWIETNGRRFQTSTGDERVVLVSRDITERRRNEQARADLEMQLRASQKLEAIGTLAGGIAHDFNNVLAAILGNLEFLLSGPTAINEGRSELQEIQRAAFRARDLVQQILAFSRRQKGEHIAVNLGMIAKETAGLLRATTPAMIQIRTEIAETVPVVMADPIHLHQVVMNLCTNAVHAMDSRDGILSIRVFPDEQKIQGFMMKGVCLEVCDTGVGMSDEVQARVFDPFYTTKSPGKGTGLGLSVVHGIVKEYSGTIIIRSTLGKGSTFVVWLPVLHRVDQIPAAIPTLVHEPLQPIERAGVAGLRVALVDDEPAVLKVGERFLRRIGCIPVIFNDPGVAIEFLTGVAPDIDLLITDKNMPKFSGIELTKAVKAKHPGLPVILATGYADSVTTDLLHQYGIISTLPKPYSLSQMAEALCKANDARR